MNIDFMDDDDFLTVKEVAEILGYSDGRIKQFIATGKLKSNRGNALPGKTGYINKMHLIPVKEVRKYLGEKDV